MARYIPGGIQIDIVFYYGYMHVHTNYLPVFVIYNGIGIPKENIYPPYHIS